LAELNQVFAPIAEIVGVVIHIFRIGLPISLIARRFSR